MQRTVFAADQPPFVWVDVVNPSPGDLSRLANDYGLHPTSVQDCLDPEHLPKFETIAGTTFLIVRGWDESASSNAASVQAATRKVAIFFDTGFLLTIHRTDQPYLHDLFARYEHAAKRTAGAEGGGERSAHVQRILVDLLSAVIATYEKPLEDAETRTDDFEATLFSSFRVVEPLRDIYVVKRRLQLIKRMLWHMLSVLQRVAPTFGGERLSPLYQDVRENAESLYSFANELVEDLDSLLNIHLALASHRTNEVVRVLTLFSVFFLPLTFIVGIYGMNFDFMPELRERWGYPAVLIIMAIVTGAIYLWFRRRGWLSRTDTDE